MHARTFELNLPILDSVLQQFSGYECIVMSRAKATSAVRKLDGSSGFGYTLLHCFGVLDYP
jgi:hypothetical protein